MDVWLLQSSETFSFSLHVCFYLFLFLWLYVTIRFSGQARLYSLLSDYVNLFSLLGQVVAVRIVVGWHLARAAT